jgi:hypothetical protein
MTAVGEAGQAEGVRIAHELLAQLREVPAVRGVYLMPPFSRYEMAADIMDAVRERA